MLFQFDEQFPEQEKELRRENIKLVHRLMELIFDINRDPFDGIGRPEPLKGNLSGYWSRRINDKHRLIYMVESNVVYLISCYGHYDDH